MNIDDTIEVEINGRFHQCFIAGLERGFGKGSPIKKVVFYIDWDEGPCRYEWPVERVKLLTPGRPDAEVHNETQRQGG